MPIQHPVLYSFRRCPYAMRARFALQISHTRCELREVVLKDKPQEMLSASPKGTVPVLINIDGQVIDESIDVMLWALRRSDPENWLSPKDGTLAEMLTFIAAFDEKFKPNLDRYKYPNRFDNVNPNEARDSAAQYLVESTQTLAHSQYLFGPSLSLADMALIPFVRQFANTDRDWFDAEPWQDIHRWLHDVLDSKLFAAIMHKYPKWVASDSGVVFPAT